MNAKQRFFDSAFNNEPCIGSTCVKSCKVINVTKHQLFDVANSNIPNKNVLNIAEATAVSNIPSKISKKMFLPTTFLQYVKDKYEENSSYMSCISKTACFSVNCAQPSLQFGWNEERKGSNGSHPSECSNRTPPSKSDTAPFSRG